MKIFFIILGTVIALGGLLLMIAQPMLGVLFALLGIAFLIYGIKYKKKITTAKEYEMSSTTYKEYIAQTEEKYHTILVAGFDHFQNALSSLLTEPNPDYDINKSEWLDYYSEYDEDDRIYMYEKSQYPVHLQAEPDNPYDINAVKVFAGDTFIGYLPRGSFPEVSEYASIDGVQTYVEIFGGKYKYLEHDAEEDYLDTFEDKYYKVRTDTTPVKATIIFRW